MKHVLFTYLSLVAVVFSAGNVRAQQKANYQLAEKFRLLEKNPITKYSTEVRREKVLLCQSEEERKKTFV